ncbi:DUF4097 family beta strand repeat-containing protein [Clostridium tertium]|uniref:DUF4097 family beta strand repeat-containing protein n=1 Tax=Clostridium tertium TaxID=1559 RepID=UPI0024B336AE|nr:DUF4097 family beta strand repeat-containing protein [Clostridium tertium]MDI9219032.1 DUF4097 domain-containing protein [Clostridium tertium]
MKKLFKIFLVLSLSVVLVGCSVKFGIESRNNDNYTDSTNYSGESINKVESIEGINKINIKIEVSSVKVMYYEGKDIEVSGTLGKLSKGITIDKSSDELTINEKSKKRNSINRDSTSDLKIKIPNSYNGNIDLEFGVGEYEVRDLKVDNINISSGVGQLLIKDISFNKLDLESGVGDVELETKEMTGDINIEGGVGSIEVSLGNVNGNLIFEGGVGNTNIRIPSDSPVSIRTDSGLGKANINAKTSGENKYVFDISMGIGEINITN